MTAQYNPDECERLVREARQFVSLDSASPPACDCQETRGDHEEMCSRHRHWMALYAARFVIEQHSARVADQLEAARLEIKHWREARRIALEGGDLLKAEVERMRPVVAAAEQYADDHGLLHEPDRKRDPLCVAVDLYRASKP